MNNQELSEEDWKVVEARLQYDIDNGHGEDIALAFVGKEELK